MVEELLQPGHILRGRYHINHIYHVSGMSTLYTAHDVSAADGQPVAVKEMAIGQFIEGASEQLLDGLDTRGRLLCSLDHPHIPRTLDYFCEQGRMYLVTDYIEGQDLETLLLNGADLPVEQVWGWGITLADTLHYLHTLKPDPLIYRDLKPANIMLDQQGTLYLVDFDIAGTFPHGVTLDPLGTDGYAAPEQYSGLVTPAIDIYALGATLHHLLTRVDPRLEPPFSFFERPIRRFNPTVPPALEDAIMQALHEDPDRRYQSAGEMGEALRRAGQPG
ncbi:MAG: hypothetical protein Kow00124_08920 [Anaerolineae bacterium]